MDHVEETLALQFTQCINDYIPVSDRKVCSKGYSAVLVPATRGSPTT